MQSQGTTPQMALANLSLPNANPFTVSCFAAFSPVMHALYQAQLDTNGDNRVGLDEMVTR